MSRDAQVLLGLFALIAVLALVGIAIDRVVFSDEGLPDASQAHFQRQRHEDAGIRQGPSADDINQDSNEARSRESSASRESGLSRSITRDEDAAASAPAVSQPVAADADNVAASTDHIQGVLDPGHGPSSPIASPPKPKPFTLPTVRISPFPFPDVPVTDSLTGAGLPEGTREKVNALVSAIWRERPQSEVTKAFDAATLSGQMAAAYAWEFLRDNAQRLDDGSSSSGARPMDWEVVWHLSLVAGGMPTDAILARVLYPMMERWNTGKKSGLWNPSIPDVLSPMTPDSCESLATGIIDLVSVRVVLAHVAVNNDSKNPLPKKLAGALAMVGLEGGGESGAFRANARPWIALLLEAMAADPGLYSLNPRPKYILQQRRLTDLREKGYKEMLEALVPSLAAGDRKEAEAPENGVPPRGEDWLIRLARHLHDDMWLLKVHDWRKGQKAVRVRHNLVRESSPYTGAVSDYFGQFRNQVDRQALSSDRRAALGLSLPDLESAARMQPLKLAEHAAVASDLVRQFANGGSTLQLDILYYLAGTAPAVLDGVYEWRQAGKASDRLWLGNWGAPENQTVACTFGSDEKQEEFLAAISTPAFREQLTDSARHHLMVYLLLSDRPLTTRLRHVSAYASVLRSGVFVEPGTATLLLPAFIAAFPQVSAQRRTSEYSSLVRNLYLAVLVRPEGHLGSSRASSLASLRMRTSGTLMLQYATGVLASGSTFLNQESQANRQDVWRRQLFLQARLTPNPASPVLDRYRLTDTGSLFLVRERLQYAGLGPVIWPEDAADEDAEGEKK